MQWTNFPPRPRSLAKVTRLLPSPAGPLPRCPTAYGSSAPLHRRDHASPVEVPRPPGAPSPARHRARGITSAAQQRPEPPSVGNLLPRRPGPRPAPGGGTTLPLAPAPRPGEPTLSQCGHDPDPTGPSKGSNANNQKSSRMSHTAGVGM